MKKYFILFLIFFFFGLCAFAQQDPVLMCIGNKEITRSEFEYSYNKNKAIAGSECEDLNDYVHLFIDFKLKILAAEAAGIDTTRAFHAELTGYRRQLAKAYFIDEVVANSDIKDEEAARKSAEVQVYVMHIFKYLPQNASTKQIETVQYLMDSIYNVVLANKGTDFSFFVNKYSDDTRAFWIEKLQMAKEFEDVAFALPKGQISKPFFTPKGLHILKVLDRRELDSDKDVLDETNARFSRQSILDKGTEKLIEKLKKEYRFEAINKNIQDLYLKGESDKTLFMLDGHKYTGSDFALFAKGHPQELRKQLSDFVIKSILDYENSCLDVKYPQFRYLMQEYRDGILLFDIMQSKVWTPSETDVLGLKAFFDAHKKRYSWKKYRYRGLVLHSVNKKIARKVKRVIRKVPYQQWADTLLTLFHDKIRIETSVFSEGENKYVDKLIYKKHRFEPLKDFPVTKVFGMKVKGPDSYLEVKSSVVADYQKELESRWLKLLRSKTKVEIKQEVLKTVNNH